MADLQKFAEGVHDYIARALQPLADRIKALEAREPVPGRDGRDGLPGVPGAPGEKGLDGKDGRDGVDGLGFDDFTIEHDGERGFTFKWQNGDRVVTKTFSIPTMLDRGVYREGAAYAKGDAVTLGGSLWIAQADTTAKPGTGEGWRLAVKKGRDGRDGEKGERGERGEKGLPGLNGRDLR